MSKVQSPPNGICKVCGIPAETSIWGTRRGPGGGMMKFEDLYCWKHSLATIGLTPETCKEIAASVEALSVFTKQNQRVPTYSEAEALGLLKNCPWPAVIKIARMFLMKKRNP
jgi:hypothetical protein